MNEDAILPSVHWEDGITLTADHFDRQERYFDSCLSWLLRYTTASFGLVGTGPRLAEGHVTPDAYDPKISIIQSRPAPAVEVTACRGITVGGGIVDLFPPAQPAALPAEEAEGIRDGDTIYIVAEPHRKVAYQNTAVDYDGQEQWERRPHYALTLNPRAEEIPWSLAVGRLLKNGTEVNLDPEYIPPCAFLSGHSRLTSRANEMTIRLKALADRFIELHRAMRDTLPVAQRAGIIAELGLDEITFAGRMVVALQESLFDAGESIQPPHKFLGQFRRLVHLAYSFASLSPRVREHFQEVHEKLQISYMASLGNVVDRVLTQRQHHLDANLAEELNLTEEALGQLEEVEEGMEAKYLDFRINKRVSSIRHFFDGEIVYELVKSLQPAMTNAADVSTSFRSLNLSGERVSYRIVLAGDPNISQYADPVRMEISINEDSYRGAGQELISQAPFKGQFNFAFDYEPQGQTINDLTVRYKAAKYTFKTVMIFKEIRLGVSQPTEAPRAINGPPPQAPSMPEPPRRPTGPGRVIPAFERERRPPSPPANDRQQPPPTTTRRRFD